MLVILPYQAELRLAQWPWITYAVIALCLLIHNVQSNNRDAIASAAKTYCQATHDPDPENNLDYLVQLDIEDCVSELAYFHEVDNQDRLRYLFNKYNDKHHLLTPGEREMEIRIFKAHLSSFQKHAPKSLDNLLSYDPSSWNPISMMVSAFSHASWGHVIGNLIFFFAFTPPLELLSRSRLKFILSFVLIELACDIPYSFTQLFTSYPVPTLGLSGIVMGMIGLSAYLMPWGRIKTIVWWFFSMRRFSMPVWLLATWFIGWDTYDLLSNDEYGGVNVLAHVCGGFAGYFVGLWLFKDAREQNTEELADEIDFMRAKRQDFSGMANTYKSHRTHPTALQWEYEAQRNYGRFLDTLHRAITVGHDSEAINLILKDYQLQAASIALYEELFMTMKDWRKGRAFYCVGRLVIYLSIQREYTGTALRVAKVCVESDPEFVLADPVHVIPFAKECLALHEAQLAYQLVKNSYQRYHGKVDKVQSDEMEQLLVQADIMMT